RAVLVGVGRRMLEGAGGGRDGECAVGGEVDVGRAAVGEADLVGVGARVDEEGVLELAAGPGVDQVDPGPQVRVAHAEVGRQAGLPGRARALEVADPGAGELLAGRLDGRVGADEV